MKKNFSVVIMIFFFLSASTFAQKTIYTAKEKTEIKCFNDFKAYALQCIHNNCSVNDSANLSYIISHYLFVDVKSDSINILSHLSEEKLIYLRKTVSSFFQYIAQADVKKTAGNLEAFPSRLSADKYLYNHFTTFQKNNTLVFFDKRTPNKTLGYILFLPVIKGISTTTKIWSWTLAFKLGKYYFISATGEEGYEYLFDPGIK